MPVENLKDLEQDSKSASWQSDGATLSLLHFADMETNTDLRAPVPVSPQLQSFRNAGAVYSEMLPAVPLAVLTQIESDFSNDSCTTLGKIAAAAAIGFTGAVLLSRSPVLAKSLFAALGIGSSAVALEQGLQFTGAAMAADSEEAQSKLALTGQQSLAKLGADLVETSPALLFGAASGSHLAGKIAALDNLSLSVRNSAEFRSRQLMPEGFHYLSGDTQSIAGLRNAESGGTNLLQAGKNWMTKTPWRGAEDGRFFKLNGSGLKASARIPGTPDAVIMGHRSEQMFHTHESAILPSSGDFNSVYKTGIVAVPKEGVLTFYEGSGKEAELLVSMLKAGRADDAGTAAESLHAKTFSSLVVDPNKELSVHVDMHWNAGQNRLEPSAIRTLDFSDTVNNLSNWQGQLNIRQIESSSEALLKPGMTDLLRKITTSNGI